MQFLCFFCIAEIKFVNTDLICLVTAQMSYWMIKCKKNVYALYDNRLHQLEYFKPVFVLYAAKKTPQKMGQV